MLKTAKVQVKEVPNGYAQNSFIEKGLAVPGHKASAVSATVKKSQREASARRITRSKDLKSETKDETVVTIKAKGGEDGRLFGSVPSKQIATAMLKQWY